VTNFLTIVVPIGESDGNLSELKSWIPVALNHGCNIILVHDYLSEKLRNEFTKSLNQFSGAEKIVNIYGTFGSPGGARNAGIEAIESRWVAFWDSDDEPYVDNFLAMLRDAEDGGFEVACGGFIQANRNNPEFSVFLNSPRNLNSVLSYPGLWRFAFRTEVIDSQKFDLLSMGEDLNFLARIRLEKRNIFFSPNVVYKYYTGGRFQLTSSINAREKLEETIELLEEMVLFQPRNSFASKILLKLFLSIIFSRSGRIGSNDWDTFIVLCRRMTILVLVQSLYELAVKKRWSAR
jgi:glycosyltransferase involved in cell wall biosynthesis